MLFALLFFVLMGRFIQIQGTGKVNGVVLATVAEEKYTKKRTIEAERGTIFDRNGKPVAEQTAAYTVVAILDEGLTVDKKHPQHVVDPEETASKLAPLLDMSEKELLHYLTKDKDQVELGPKGRDISFERKQEIEALNLPGIGFRRELKRYYPNGTFAAHVVGYAQKVAEDDKGNKNVTVGKLGIEKSLDKYLRETDGYMTFQSDKKGYKLPDAKEQIVPPDNGEDVYLTIDKTIQTFLEDAMNNAVKEYEPEKIIGIVANPKTGEILAMGTRPSFDPNERNITNYLNDAIAYPYEPGSTMKIYTLAAAIEEGVYNGNATYMSGSYKIGQDTIRDYNYDGWGEITYDEGVLHSSNVGFAKIAKEQLGTDRLREYLHRFGFDRLTGIDLAGEEESIINFKSEIDRVVTAFGQGSAFTPIQQIQAVTAIANNGEMMKPYVVDKVVDPDTKKTILDHKAEVSGKPISPETAKKVRDLLEKVVTDGTGKLYNLEGYQVAGKTGTAEISENGSYLTGKGNYFYSFMGMAPKDDPKLVVYIAVKKPKLKVHEVGPEPVAMIFNPVMKNSLQYLNIEPIEKASDKQVVESKPAIELPSYIGKTLDGAKAGLEKDHLNAIILGTGNRIQAQSPRPKDLVVSGERVFLVTNGEQVLPDTKGWSMRDVSRLTQILGLKVKFEGNGFVVEQSIPPGSAVKKGDQLQIKLKPPGSEVKTEEKENTEHKDKNG